jgi:hypothetical protein
MPMLILLFGVIFLSVSSFVASADGSRPPVVKKSEDMPAPSVSLCARKISLGPDGREVGCLMQRHKGRDRS